MWSLLYSSPESAPSPPPGNTQDLHAFPVEVLVLSVCVGFGHCVLIKGLLLRKTKNEKQIKMQHVYRHQIIRHSLLLLHTENTVLTVCSACTYYT